jgi:GTPase Era involved in 16S rRNA processing
LTTESVSLEEAVRSAVEQGHAELTRLDAITDDLTGVFGPEQPAGPSPSRLISRLEGFLRWFPGDLRRHLDRERESLGTFNIAFFGRTGVGKSTLLSVFGRLDGEYVSPGASDWTTEVRPIEWRDCRLFDTPGINGWGRTQSRDSLEAEARKAVEIADIVLLCFDNQAQQEMEFAKIAAWIRDHGKPAVAVLNVRNARWRHPAIVPEAQRRNPSEAVRQHADNIRTQLAQIGLPDTPVVAIHSQRALFARAGTPFHGPETLRKAFDRQREEFGEDYLERWSNFPALERLIVTSIAEGSADLRLSALREDLRSRCRRGIGELDGLAAEMEREATALEKEAESLFDLVGYPEDAERAEWLHDAALSADLVEVSERARGVPYTSPPKGSLDRFVRHLAASHLAGCRRQAKARADDLIRTAFDEHKAIDESAFAEAVFDQETIAAAAEAVRSGRREFLERERRIAADQRAVDTGSAVSHAVRILGDEGGGVTGEIIRGTGIALGASTLAAVFFWNPAGWVFGAVAAGIGIAGQVQQYFGKKVSREATERARKAKAEAIADCHRAVEQTFADYEDALVRDSRKAAWTAVAPAAGESLRAAIELRAARGRLVGLIDSLRAYADAIRPAPAAADVLRRAQRRMGDSPADVTRALLGEDWLGSGADHRPARIDPAVHDAYARRRQEDGDRLARALAAAWSAPPAAGIHAWRDELEEAARHDPALFDVVKTFWRVDGARPVLAVLGDYNSGKSSLIRRIVVDDGRQPSTTFDIRASPATATASRYPLARVDLVDTPGLQSGHDGHDTAALEAVAEAALVFVVVHINLLVGNTALLEELSRGSASAAAKGARMVFLVNRCDELGVDPLTGALAGLSGERLSAASSSAAFDAAVTGLERHRHALLQVRADGTTSLDRTESLIVTLRAAVSDAEFLGDSLREDARRMVDRHAAAAKSAVAEIDRKDAAKMADLVDSWWKAPQVAVDLEGFLADAARRLDEWHSDHIGAIGREMRAAAFSVTPEFAAEFEAHGRAWHESVTEGAGTVAGTAATMAAALASRDAVYAIGKFLGHNFKPWGAVKGAGNVARGAAVLGAVAAVVDAASMATDVKKAGDHRRQQESALAVIDESAAGLVDRILHGEQGDGPVGELERRAATIGELLGEQHTLASSIRERVEAARARAEVTGALIAAAEKIVTSGGNE